ncbi:NAD-dependent epimerase/dehydratase family protein [Goodfellowiella coeruleoviolacea]|uniref:Nucleoside-diphosphate-sugar epimerase n=1 Tax=Goodfellowiella coeruleoviolacea TaxID=334858 RepID=A0AAE3KEC5_9PSEU|nr:NAD-dependent epimerase/dehydratase family protein [Goodfellowiella coeruleoviolacea]MCP2163762.1 Nucleoside-diphosphate-sugar epimerase [Goodfellowiella coeruleoviolacea]
MRVVIIGASGNIGTALLRRLAHEADVTAVGVARRRPHPGFPYDTADWHQVDIGTPHADTALAGILAGADAVVHLAWLIQPSHDESALYQTNVAGSRRVFAAAVRADVPHLVCLSSIGAYSPADKQHPVREDWPTGGIAASSYSRHKAAVERLLDGVELGEPARVISRIRPGLVLQRDAATEIQRYFLGPFVPRGLFGLARRARLPVLPVPSRLTLQFVHADDLAEALVRVLRTRLAGALNVATDPVASPRTLARILGARHLPVPGPLLRAAAGLAWRLRLLPTSPGWIDLALSCPVMSTERARRELGWQPRHDTEQTLRDLLDGLAHGAGQQVSPPLRPRRGPWTVAGPLVGQER